MKKSFVLYLIVLIIPLVVMGGLSYTWSANVVKEQTERVYIDMLTQTSSNIERKFDELNQFADTLAMSQWVQKITLMNTPSIDYTRVDPIALNNYLKELNNYNSLNDFVDQLAVVVHNKRLVLYPDGEDNVHWFFSHSYNFEGMNEEDWMDSMKGMMAYGPPKIINNIGVHNYDRYYKMFVYMKTLPILDQTPRATLLAMIKEDTIKELLGGIRINDKASVYVFDANKELVTGLNLKPAVEDMLRSQIYTNTSGILNEKIKDEQGNRYFAFYVVSKSYIVPWTYVALFPVNVVMAKVENIKYVTLFLVAVLLAIGFLLSYRFAMSNCMDIRELIGTIKDKMRHPSLPVNTNGYGYDGIIAKGVDDICDQYNTAVLNNIFAALLNGQNEAIVDKCIDELLSYTYHRSLFAVAIFDADSEANRLKKQILQDNWSAYSLIQNKKIVTIININKNDQLNEAIAFISDLFSQKITVGVGGLYDLEYLWKSYNEAQVAIDYELLKGKGSIIYFTDINTEKNKLYYYPLQYEVDLVECVKKKDFITSTKLLHHIVKQHISQSALSLAIERYLFYKRTAAALEQTPEDFIEMILLGHKEELLSSETIDDIQSSLENICREIYTAVLQQKDNYDYQLIKHILQYIEANYADASLSLVSLADTFSMSAPQMSKFFKDHVGENFIQFLSRLRIRVAKELLTNNNELNMEDVCKQVGYNDVLTFRRAFKKYENITPGKFKELGSEIMNQ